MIGLGQLKRSEHCADSARLRINAKTKMESSGKAKESMNNTMEGFAIHLFYLLDQVLHFFLIRLATLLNKSCPKQLNNIEFSFSLLFQYNLSE